MPGRELRGPSPHLSWDELACHDAARTPYPEEWRSTRAVVLGAEFEIIRLVCGDRPIHVASGYRTPAHNAAVGGHPTSEHKEGRAGDLWTPDGLALVDFHSIVFRVAHRGDSKLGTVGFYHSWNSGRGGVHIDIKPREGVMVFREAA